MPVDSQKVPAPERRRSTAPQERTGAAGQPAVLAIDLGGTLLRLAVADGDGAIRERQSCPVDPTVGPAQIIRLILASGRELLRSCDIRSVSAIGLSTPGIVDPACGVVLAAHNLHAWANVRIGEALADGFGAPVSVENDVNLAALGEHRRVAGVDVDPLVFIAAGTGVGAGIILGGRIHRGAHLAAGEVNALPSGVRREDGREEGVEAVASGPAIVRRAAERGVTPAAGELTTETIFALARAGDAAAEAVIDDAAVALSRAAAALAVAIDPAMIVLGGGLSVQGEELLLPIRGHLAALGLTRTPIVRSALGIDAQLHGAIIAALDLVGGEDGHPAGEGGTIEATHGR